ncbi:MAG: alcohol dehydrogenase catalytic domain-containing protein [Planctomycetes bacterium]|nr:alcohol dehydrogenase catalytic domain-containing protein [Planctomycetota bacterium]
MTAARYLGNHAFALEDAPVPQPAAGEVRLRVAWCGICGTDMHIFHGKMDARVKPPQIIGHEMSGIVDAVGPGVTGWSPGDHVTVRPLDSCGVCAACRAGHSHVCMRLKFVGIDSPGAFQGLWCVQARLLHRLPADLPLDLAALIEPLAVACHDVRRSRLAAGEKAVVLGGGPIGILVALVARAAGAQVRISEIDAGRRAFATALGLEVLGADTAAEVEAWTDGAGADVVFECTAAAPCAALMTQLARVRGRIVLVGIFTQPVQIDLFRVFWRELELLGARVYEAADFEQAIALAPSLPLDRLVSGRFALTEIGGAFAAAPTGMKTLVACS